MWHDPIACSSTRICFAAALLQPVDHGGAQHWQRRLKHTTGMQGSGGGWPRSLIPYRQLPTEKYLLSTAYVCRFCGDSEGGWTASGSALPGRRHHHLARELVSASTQSACARFGQALENLPKLIITVEEQLSATSFLRHAPRVAVGNNGARLNALPRTRFRGVTWHAAPSFAAINFL
jgi:hypothetical protein